MYSSALCSCAAPCTPFACFTTSALSVSRSTAANTWPNDPSPSRPPVRTVSGENFFSFAARSKALTTYASNAPEMTPSSPIEKLLRVPIGDPSW